MYGVLNSSVFLDAINIFIVTYRNKVFQFFRIFRRKTPIAGYSAPGLSGQFMNEQSAAQLRLKPG